MRKVLVIQDSPFEDEGFEEVQLSSSNSNFKINYNRHNLFCGLNKTGLLYEYLYDLDPKDGTTSVHIHNVMQQYSNERNLTYDHTSRYKPFYTIATITNAIDRNTPVEVFGSLGNPSSKG
ncbi:MAG: hypothetical protein EOM11_10865, partial [Erysipelotrichia bacterium]|nr:hypothetical protein [Erysipelotrichia bacterium]